METRALGRTGMEISRIVFGCGAVGGVIFKAKIDQSIEAVRRALAQGINWFDTAASYGDGQSEKRLGEILRTLGASPRVSTKVVLAPEELNDIPGAIRRSLDRSLSLLGHERVDLFQLHNLITPQRGDQGPSISVRDVIGSGGVAEAFDRLRQEGLFDATGFTGAGDTGSLMEVVKSARFDCVQTHFNLLNPSSVQEVPEGFRPQDFGQFALRAHEQGMGVLNIRVLAAGVLAGRDLEERPGGVDGGEDAAERNARMARLREALGVDDQGLYQTALRFALMQEAISGVLVGFSTPEHVDQAVLASGLPELDEERLEVVRSLCRPL